MPMRNSIMRNSIQRVFLGALLGGALFAVAASAQDRFEVREVSAQYERVFDGIVEPVQQSTMSAQTSGRIVELNFDVNDVVPKGSVILRLDDTEQQARVRQADADVREATARLKEARDDHERVKSLVGRKLASQADLDRAQAQLNAAQARQDMTQARLAEAKQQLAYTVVTAPYGGVVVARHVQVGETAQVGQRLMTGFSLEELRIATTVPQDLVGAVRGANRARVMTDTGVFESDAITVFPFADDQSHGFRVRVALPPSPSGLMPGMFVKVGFPVGSEARLVVPRQSIVQRGEVTGVYVFEAESAEPAFRYVRIGRPQDPDMVEVLAGVQVGETIALNPQNAAASRRDAQK